MTRKYIYVTKNTPVWCTLMKKQPAIIKKNIMTWVATQFSIRNCRIFPGLFNENCSFSKDTDARIKTDKKSQRFLEFQPKDHR